MAGPLVHQFLLPTPPLGRDKTRPLAPAEEEAATTQDQQYKNNDEHSIRGHDSLLGIVDRGAQNGGDRIQKVSETRAMRYSRA